MSAETLPGLLEAQAARRPKGIAIRHKHLGIWRELTWSEYATAVREVALALDELGVRAGDRIAIASENNPNWLVVDLAVQATGAWSVGAYAALDADDLAAVIRDSGARIVFCGDQEQVDKVLDRRAQFPSLERMIVFDTKGLHTVEYESAPLESFAGLRARGRELLAQQSERFAELLAERSADDVALVSFTSGTTGPPRGALLRHGGEVALARLVAERLGLGPSDRAYSLLPLGHATARLFDAYAPLVAGSSVNFAESPETIRGDLVEIAPTVLVATPRLLERVRGEVELRIERATPVKRGAYRLASRLMRSRGPGRALGRALVGRFVVRQAGLGALRYGGVAGSFLAPELLRWFWALGVPFREQYGQVETGGVVATQLTDADLGTAGRPLGEAIDVRVDDDGELLVRSPGVLAGYVGDQPAPVEDGWYRTGDVVRIDPQGRLVPVSRRAHLVTTDAGEELSPAEIEGSLKLSPYISSAMVVAERRPFVSAVVELNQEAVADWARRNDVAVTTYAALVGNEKVLALVDAEIRAANDRLPDGRRVDAFRVLPQPLDSELTPTGKIKRAVVADRYAELIDDIYAG